MPTLKSQINGFEKPIWKYYLNYETKFLKTDEIVTLSYKYIKQLEKIKLKYNSLTPEEYYDYEKLLNFLENLTNTADKIWRTKGRKQTNEFMEKMCFDKTDLNIKSKLTPILFPELSISDYFKNFIKFSSYTLKNKFHNIFS